MSIRTPLLRPPLHMGTTLWPLYRVGFIEGLFYKLFIWDLGAWPLYLSWPLFRGGLYSGVAVKMGYAINITYAIDTRLYFSPFRS